MGDDQRAYGFGAAGPDERIVFGARRPGFNLTDVGATEVDAWIDFVRGQGVRRVVCLLPDEQLAYYRGVPGGLLGHYASAFGPENVAHRPIADFRLSDPETLRAILGDLRDADSKGEKVVVHCSGGIGRTGHVLAAWLVHGRGYGAEGAIAAVKQMGRNPREAVDAGIVAEDELLALLDPAVVQEAL